MSGPASTADAIPVGPEAVSGGVEVTASREATVGTTTVRRALPRRGRRTVGAWCFADHFGPETVPPRGGMEIGPHPHIGLHTVTWLLAGEVLHLDSLGSEQVIRPGQLNLMTAGRGIVHAELPPPAYGGGTMHGVQLWVAQPESARHDEPAFAHHADLPQAELGAATATVLTGELAGARSPAVTETPLVGAQLALRNGTVEVPLRPDFEHALVVLDGAIAVADHPLTPGTLAYVGDGRDEIALTSTEPATVLLLGGTPFGEEVLMWWNFVARTRDEVVKAYRDWDQSAERFGRVAADLDRIPAPPPPWLRD